MALIEVIRALLETKDVCVSPYEEIICRGILKGGECRIGLWKMMGRREWGTHALKDEAQTRPVRTHVDVGNRGQEALPPFQKCGAKESVCHTAYFKRTFYTLIHPQNLASLSKTTSVILEEDCMMITIMDDCRACFHSNLLETPYPQRPHIRNCFTPLTGKFSVDVNGSEIPPPHF